VRGYIYFDFVNGGKYQYLFYNKENKEFFSASHKYVTIDGMLPFRIINRDMKEDKVLAFVEPYMLFDYLKKNNINLEQTTLLDKDDIELLSKMKEDDNPYLIKLSIK